MENRRLIGRRYEDFRNGGIEFGMGPHEYLWRTVFIDPRYRSLLDRRHEIRRKSDRDFAKPVSLFEGQCALLYINSDVFSEDENPPLNLF